MEEGDGRPRGDSLRNPVLQWWHSLEADTMDAPFRPGGRGNHWHQERREGWIGVVRWCLSRTVGTGESYRAGVGGDLVGACLHLSLG